MNDNSHITITDTDVVLMVNIFWYLKGFNIVIYESIAIKIKLKATAFIMDIYKKYQCSAI